MGWTPFSFCSCWPFVTKELFPEFVVEDMKNTEGLVSSGKRESGGDKGTRIYLLRLCN